ncbi:MAG: transporter permease [Glaciihabitans sp.]|nr:transporter permease [Glaciihabitans sp.]
MKNFSFREHIPSILVAALSSAFGVSLLQVTDVLASMIGSDAAVGVHSSVQLALSVVALVFIVISVYVGAITTANTFATIIAGRTRIIALYRLIGSSAAAQRRAVAREGLAVGVIGAFVGTIVGSALTIVGVGIAVASHVVPGLEYSFFSPVLLLPIVGVILTTWLASWVGSRRVLNVSPMQATGAAQEASLEEVSKRPGRNILALVLFILGTGLLLLGIFVGLSSPGGVLIGVVGGILSFTAIVLSAELVMPPVLRFVGRWFGSSAPARLAAENATRYPERSSRTTIGLVIGVTLITTFGVAIQSFEDMIHAAQRAQPGSYQGTEPVLAATTVVFSVLIGFSALIAAVGMVNNLSLSVLQRTRELGLLRALGFTARQVRRMILAESAHLTVAAVVVGLVLGILYGWAGAQSLLGAIKGSPGIVLPGIPILLLLVVIVAAALLTLIASVAPSRRAIRVAPVAALAVE